MRFPSEFSRIYYSTSFFQIASNVLTFSCVNIVGILLHSLTENAQRKVFLDTRNCISARLHIEDENEKLVCLEIFRIQFDHSEQFEKNKYSFINLMDAMVPYSKCIKIFSSTA